MTKIFKKLLGDSRGSTAVEYGLIAGLVGLALAGTMGNVGEKMNAPLECSADVVAGTKTTCN